MKATLTKALAIATIGMFATGAFAADRLNANNNKVDQDNRSSRAEQKVKIGFMDGPLLGSATVNANRNTVKQTNRGSRAKQQAEIGVYK
ncbi:MAG: hypothetical protein KDH15_16300 [Rhodocyclaceae bacterium]|nr:hypothetical protein [Rhodocyclaceae bacterium]